MRRFSTNAPAPAAMPGGADAPGRRIAVIGSGISGAASAYLLARSHDVTLFEAEGRLGGHSNTIDVDLGGVATPVDTGFIVYNELNYPHFAGMLDHLGVATHRSDMSFAVSLDDKRLEYSGEGLRGIFAQRRNLLRPSHWQMLFDLLGFYRQAARFAQLHDLTEMTLDDLLVRFGCSAAFRRAHILPMAAAIWSTPYERIMDFPAAAFVRFFENHGLFRLSGRPRWRTVTGGSRAYVQALSAAFHGTTRLAAPITSVGRSDDGVWVTPRGSAPERFDAAVIATHADQALAMLDRPTAKERALLGAFDYESNKAVVHRDPAFMPGTRRCWASWNYLSHRDGQSEKLLLTYWMNRLQGLNPSHNLFITLNPHRAPRQIVAEIDYEHPCYSKAALAAQQRFGELQGAGGIWFAGAHFGHGFHEDGLAAAVSVAADFGIAAPWNASVAVGERAAAA